MSKISNLKKVFTSNISLTSGSIRKNVFLFALPVCFTSLLQLFYNIADQLIGTNFGPTPFITYTAIASTSMITSLCVAIFQGFSIGSNVCLANAFGEKNFEKGKRVIASSLSLVIIVSIIMTTICCLLARYFLIWLNTASYALQQANTFLTIYFACIPFLMLYDTSASLLRAVGDSKKPFYVLCISALINISLSFLFVMGFKMGIEGVASATFISETFAGIIAFIFLMKNKTFVNIPLKAIRPYKEEVIQILKVGIPASIQGSFFAIPNLIMQSDINELDAITPGFTAGSGAAYQLETFITQFQNCFGQACIAFVAANYGARNFKRVKESIFTCVSYAILGALISGITFYLIRYPLFNLFIGKTVSDNPNSYQNALNAANLRASINYTTYVTFAICDCIPYALRGLKKSTPTMIISLIGICGLRVLFLLTIYKLDYFHNGFWLFMMFPISWSITGILQVILLTIEYNKLKRINLVNRQ